MAATVSPAILPIATSPSSSGITSAAASSASGSTAQSAAPVSTPAFLLFLSRLQGSISRTLSACRPWPEFVDRFSFSRPESLPEATSRLRKNFAYFRVNYLVIIAAALALSLVFHPASLIVLLALLASWCFLYIFRPSDLPLVLFGRTFSDRETLIGLTAITAFVVFVTSVGFPHNLCAADRGWTRGRSWRASRAGGSVPQRPGAGRRGDGILVVPWRRRLDRGPGGFFGSCVMRI